MFGRISDDLKHAFGHRYAGLILFGSSASGEDTEASDIDLLLLVDGPVDVGLDIRRAVHATDAVRSELPRSLSILPVPRSSYEANDYPLYRNIHQHGIAL